MLINNREIFFSQEIYYSFVGYANGQLYKMKVDERNLINKIDKEIEKRCLK